MERFGGLAVPIAAAVHLTVLAAPVSAQEGFPGDKGRDEWNNDFVVYLWAVNMDATSTVGTNQVPLDVSFSDLWDKMKFAASGHYEGRKGNWGVLLDGSYVNLGEDGITVIAGPRTGGAGGHGRLPLQDLRRRSGCALVPCGPRISSDSISSAESATRGRTSRWH